jgi:hypothetical protein
LAAAEPVQRQQLLEAAGHDTISLATSLPDSFVSISKLPLLSATNVIQVDWPG